MTANSEDYVTYVMEQLAPIDGIVSARMFGGIGLKIDGTQFAILMGNSLYFVVNDDTRPAYEKMGSQCFSYNNKKGRVNVRKYYEVPGDLMEDQAQLVSLARESIGVAKAYNGQD